MMKVKFQKHFPISNFNNLNYDKKLRWNISINKLKINRMIIGSSMIIVRICENNLQSSMIAQL